MMPSQLTSQFKPKPLGVATVVIAVLLLSMTTSETKAGPLYYFQSQPQVVVRHRSGNVMRGVLVSIDEEKAVLNVRSREVEVKFTQMTSLRSADGTIQYNSRISMADFLKSLENLEDVDLNGSGGTEPPPDQNSGGNGGFGSARPPAMEKPETSDPKSNGGFGTKRPQANGSTTDEYSTKTTVTCAKCNKTVSVSAKAGDQCPHCGILWDTSPESPDLVRVNSTPSVQPGDGNHAEGHSNNSNHVQRGGHSPVRGSGSSDAVPSNSVPPSMTAGPPPPLTVGSMPVAVKAFIFIFFTGVAYYLFFYRR